GRARSGRRCRSVLRGRRESKPRGGGGGLPSNRAHAADQATADPALRLPPCGVPPTAVGRGSPGRARPRGTDGESGGRAPGDPGPRSRGTPEPHEGRDFGDKPRALCLPSCAEYLARVPANENLHPSPASSPDFSIGSTPVGARTKKFRSKERAGKLRSPTGRPGMKGDTNSEIARGHAKQSLVIIVPRARLELCRALSHAFGDEAHVRVIPDRRFKDRR